jgi:hypothetical protein
MWVGRGYWHVRITFEPQLKSILSDHLSSWAPAKAKICLSMIVTGFGARPQICLTQPNATNSLFANKCIFFLKV